MKSNLSPKVSHHAESKRVSFHSAYERVNHHAASKRVSHHAASTRVSPHAASKRLSHHAASKRVSHHAASKRVGHHATSKRVSPHAASKRISHHAASKRVSHHAASKRPSCNHPIDFDGNAPFPDIVLALNFNHPHYKNLPILERFFKPLFPTYIVCGPEKHKGGYHIVVIQQPGEYSSYGSQCVVEAIRRKPGYAGYFYVSDDMIINWWNFFKLDKTKIWFPEPYKLGEHKMSPAKTDSRWWKRSDCLERCSQVFLEMESDPTMLELNATKMYLENLGGRRVCSNALSDIVYIPGRLAKSYKNIAQKFYDKRVFLEVTTPMCMLMVDKRDNIADIKGLYLQTWFGWGRWKRDSYRAWHYFNYNTYFLHPYKLSNAKSTKEFEKRIVIPSEKILKDKCLDVLDRGKFWV